MDNVSRKRCRAALELGGLNVVNFRAKCNSLRVSCFASLKDDFGASKWHYLACSFIGSRFKIQLVSSFRQAFQVLL